jgi:hypothetical protein
MKFAKMQEKGKSNLYTEPDLLVIAKGVEDVGRVSISSKS